MRRLPVRHAALAAALLAAATPAATAAPAPCVDGSPVADEAIVRLATPLRGTRAAAGARLEVGGRRARATGIADVAVVRVDGPGALAALAATAGVLEARPNRVICPLAAVRRSATIEQWALDAVNARGAWQATTGAAEVAVGLVDTGIDATHPDLAANVAPAGDPLHGHDWTDGDDEADDAAGVAAGHGTHVAGIVGATGDGGGTRGVAWHVRLVPLRIVRADGYATEADLASALAWAGAARLRVVNASLGARFRSDVIDEAIAGAPDTLFVFPAGNDGAELGDADDPFYPCESPGPNVLCVGATDLTDALAPYSNTGPTAVDLAAPGDDVISTVPGGGYAAWSGTSMAAPHVAGAAALRAAARPDASALDLRTALLAGARHVVALDGLVDGGRLLDVGGALAALGVAGAGGVPVVLAPRVARRPGGAAIGVRVDPRGGRVLVRVSWGRGRRLDRHTRWLGVSAAAPLRQRLVRLRMRRGARLVARVEVRYAGGIVASRTRAFRT